MGDPSGIGPEIIVATLAEMPEHARSKSVVIGNIDLLRRADQLRATGLKFVTGVDANNGDVPVIHVPTRGQEQIADGKESPARRTCRA